MPSRINTVVLGVEPYLLDVLAIEGRGTPRFSLRPERGADIRASAQAEVVFVPAVASDMALLDDDLRPLFAWVERICRDPGLSDVDSSAVPTVLRFSTECDLAAICARRGIDLTMIAGQLRNLDRDGSRAMQAHLATLAAGGVDLVHLVPRSAAPTIGRSVVRRVLSPKVLTSLADAGLDILDAVFATPAQVAEATGRSHLRAVILQLEIAEEVMRCRTEIWRGVGSALDVRLAMQAAALRRLASSGVGQRPAMVAARSPEDIDGTLSAPSPALVGPPHTGSLETRRPRLGEAVAVVPVFDAATGMSSVVHIRPRFAEALRMAGRAGRRPGCPIPPSPRPSLVGRLLAKIRSRRADRR